MAWRPEAEPAGALADTLSHTMDAASAWTAAQDAPGLRLWTTRRDPPDLRFDADRDTAIVGTLFDHMGDRNGAEGSGDAVGTARQLSRSHWGRYIALLRDRGGDPWCVYRDPSGAMPAFTWSLTDGVSVVASQIDELPPGLGPRRPALNWDRIAEFVAKPAACATGVLVDDVIPVHPGQLIRLGSPTRIETIWSPSTFAADPIDDAQVAGCELKRRVTACTTSLVGHYDRLLLEVSGGLDSAILAGTLHMTGQAFRITEGLNIAFGRPESDEQAYATAVAERAGLRLIERTHAPDALDLEDLAEMASEFRPSANAVDPKWDRDEIDRLRATGAQAIVSGQGGDAMFMQMSGAGVVADAWARGGWATFREPVLADVARRNRRSVWSLLRDARAERQGRAPPPEALWSSLITREVRDATLDLKPRWLEDAEAAGLPPGKQLHVHALGRFFLNEGPSRRRREADILYPLFAQPVVEQALRIPTPILAGANYDRAYARDVFADRLPDIVRARRAKGLVTVYFARLIANSLPVLRPFLVDGCLAEARILDRAKLEQALTVEHLIWAAKPSDILWAVAAEAWVRHRQSRVPDSASAPRHR
ncbi:MAG TPA: asparagine synthase C-terminal domain-containing protein [Phenylobacterium sp.]|nr:asparagine synthase C-terminal domain-containing protein [Phenylobacterium sp.]